MRKRRVNYSNYFQEAPMIKESREVLDPVRQIDRIQSVAWHRIEGVSPELNEERIRIEDESGTVHEISVGGALLDLKEKRANRYYVSLWLYRIMMQLHDQGLIEKGPCLVEIYQNMSDAVNYLREKFPYTGPETINLYADGITLINPWKDPEMFW